MALFHISMKSHALDMGTNLYVILPSDEEPMPEGGFPVLYLLHGLSDDHTKWLRATRIEEYAAKYHLCVVMPEVQRSFYSNMTYGLNYDDFISKELPAFIKATFPVTADRARTFVAGLSMGGYGAMKFGLRDAAMFGACASLSGAVNPVDNFNPKDEWARKIIVPVLGEEGVFPDDCNLFRLAERQAALPEEQRTRLYLAVGTEDFLYGDNQRFREHLDALGLAYTYEEGPGTHSWNFWDEYIRHALAFFFEK